jgi:hypothetical protein
MKDIPRIYFRGTACAFFFFQEGTVQNRFFLFGAVKKKKAGAPVRSCPRPRRAGNSQLKITIILTPNPP